jgi:diguanylate cyclase (GGDEF)-like protein
MLFARFSINLKLLTLSILPLLVLVAFLTREGIFLYDTIKNNYQTQTITKLALKLDNVAHQHALERGLTEGFLGSNGTNGEDIMLAQRKKSDQAVAELEYFMWAHQNDLQNINTDSNVHSLINILKHKKGVREDVYKLSNEQSAFTYYSLVNKKAIDTIYLLTKTVEDSTIRSELSSMVAMLWLKERAGQSRGALNGVYANGKATIEAYTHIYSFIKDFDNTLELLINNSDFHTKVSLADLARIPISIQIETIQNNFISQMNQLNNIQGPAPEKWFPLATERINTINAIVDEQASYTLYKSQDTLAQSQRYLMMVSSIMVLVISALIYLSYNISLNISSRIRNINTLLTQSVDNNDLSIQIDDQGDDEITHIAKGINSYISWVKDNLSNAEQVSLAHEYLANHDPLTKLANRSLFFTRLTQLTEQLNRLDRHHAILYIDLDFFKKINDKYGHYIGDKVLQVVANRLVSNVRIGDTVARLGGDEFAVILEGITSKKAHLVSQNLLEDIRNPMLIDNLTLHISVSIGMTFFPNEESDDPNILLKQADHALYDAKKLGRRQYRYFDKALKQVHDDNIQLENDLHSAIEKQEIFPHFQPQYCLQTQTIIGLETLARWEHPEKGFIPPDTFIPLAERLSLISLLTKSIMFKAGKYFLSFININPDLKLAINISASDCSSPHIIKLTQKLIEENLIKPEQIELDVTESALIHHPDSSIEVLNALNELGISIAIDDFGTGYSSLSYLTAFPIDVLKIDISFVAGIGVNPKQESIILVIIDLAKRLSLKVLAEGIETQAQVDFLVKNGCDYGQGYFYSKPCSYEGILEILEANNRQV